MRWLTWKVSTQDRARICRYCATALAGGPSWSATRELSPILNQGLFRFRDHAGITRNGMRVNMDDEDVKRAVSTVSRAVAKVHAAATR